MNDEIHGLRADIEALRLECAELHAMVAQQQLAGQGYDPDLLESVMFRAPTPDEAPLVPSEAPPRRPFDVWFDFKAKEWRTYLPDGCVTVGGVAAEFAGDKTQDVATMPAAGEVYCHVLAKDGNSGGYQYELSSQSENSDALYVVPVAKFTPDTKEVTALLAGGGLRFESPKKKAYVVTNVSQVLDEDKGLILYVKKAPVLVDKPSGSEASTSLSESSTSTTVATLTKVTYVTGSVYNPANHSFRNQTRTVEAIIVEDEATSDSVSVFTAEPVCGSD